MTRANIVNMVLNVSLFLCAVVICEAAPASQHICHRVSDKINIDGKLDDSSWQKADVVTFIVPATGKKPLSKTEAKILWDDSYLYIAYRAYDKDIWSVFKDRDSTTCQEDCLECFIQPRPEAELYYNFEINAQGTVYDSYNISRNSGGYDHHRWSVWNCDGMHIGIVIDGSLNNCTDIDRCWQMELAIPFAELPSMGGKRPKVGDQWKFLLARYDFSIYLPDGAELSSSSHLSKVDFHDSSEWSRLSFAE